MKSPVIRSGGVCFVDEAVLVNKHQARIQLAAFFMQAVNVLDGINMALLHAMRSQIVG